MGIKNPVVNKIFDDLDDYLNWCRSEGKVYNEAALYNKDDSNWQQYEKYVSYLSNLNKKSNKNAYKAH